LVLLRLEKLLGIAGAVLRQNKIQVKKVCAKIKKSSRTVQAVSPVILF
jgi:hypothetical protein